MIKLLHNEEIAEMLLLTGAVKINTKDLFTFASGIKSPIYCDNRFLLGFPKERSKVITYFQEIIQSEDHWNVIMGTSTAGIPWASFIADQKGLPMGYVRSAKKSHGTSKLIEGADVAGKDVLLIEDLITTGASVLAAVENLRTAGAKSVAVAAIFTYAFSKTYLTFEEQGIDLKLITDLETLIKIGVNKHYLTKEDENILFEWKKSKEA